MNKLCLVQILVSFPPRNHHIDYYSLFNFFKLNRWIFDSYDVSFLDEPVLYILSIDSYGLD